MFNLLILLLVSCSSYISPPIRNNREAIQIKLLVDKNKILANGIDFCKFETKDKDGNEIIADIYLNNEKMNSEKFSTFKEGTYSFFAIFNNIKSNLVNVDAIKVVNSLDENKGNLKSMNEETKNEFSKEAEEIDEVVRKDRELEIYELLSKGQIEESNLDILGKISIDEPLEQFNGMNLLSIALVNTKNFDLLLKVLELKRDLNFRSCDQNGNTFLHFLLIASPLEEDKNFKSKWKKLLDKFKEVTHEYFTELLSIKNKDGLSPFQIGILLKDIKKFKILIKDINISSFFLERDNNGNTLSHTLVEVMGNATEFTEFLNLLSSSKGFNLNYLSYKNNEGNSALIKAILSKKHDIAKILAKRKNHKNEYIKLSIDYIKEKCKVDDEYIDKLLE